MNIFNYLMNKKGHEIFNNDDILSYLLKKGRVHKASGTEINIKNAKGFESLTLSKLSTQEGTPTPENPSEVNTVKGYRNLFDGILELGIINGASGADASNSNYIRAKDYIPVEELTNYKFSTNNSNITSIYVYEYKQDKSYNLSTNKVIQLTEYLTTNADTKYIRFRPNFETTDTTIKFQLTEGTTIKPYVPYGTNYIYTTITDGTNTKYVTIPLNDNEICGIGDYKDELVIDKNGHCWLNKKINKKIIDENVSSTSYLARTNTTRFVINNLALGSGLSNSDLLFCNRLIGTSQIWTNDIEGCYIDTDYLVISINKDLCGTTVSSLQNYLSNNNLILYYPLATPTEIDLGTVDMELYEGTNNITNSEDMDMLLEYYK